ncbi:MAG: CRISPR-associated RAMP protein [Myxococcales bacterium]|nr:CRISPR-associated RAMP protein [Myxococcales bacterium]
MSALRIGVGRSHDALGTDLPVLRDARGVPMIPGASIKGVLRSQVEALFRATNPEWARDPFEPQPEAEEAEGSAADRAAARQREVAEHADEAGKIFGMPSLASHVRVGDATPVGSVIVEVRDGVAIDRDLGRVSGSKKYDYEVIAAGSRFQFELMMDGLDDAREGAVVAGLELLDEGFARLGGFKSRGLGRVRLDEMQVSRVEGPSLERSEPSWQEFRARRMEAFRSWMRESQKGAA